MEKLLEEPGQTQGISWGYRVAGGAVVLACALLIATGMGQSLETAFELSSQQRQWVHAVVTSLITIPAIILLRKIGDKESIKEIGFDRFSKALKYFFLGMFFAALPIFGTYVVFFAFGWMEIVSFPDNFIQLLSSGFLIVLFFEALPEEIVMRGYIYHNLNVRFVTWKAALITTFLFASVPIVIGAIGMLIGIETSFNGQEGIQINAIMIFLVFGALSQIVRIATGSVWASVGLHLGLVYFDRVIGITSNKIIQTQILEQPVPFGLLAFVLLLVSVALIILFPKMTHRKWNWNKKYEGESHAIS